MPRQTFLRKQSVEAPASIRIYRRGPENNSCEGRVDVIPLEEYVRGVVPHEWIPSWHPESLRAGAIAARSYAWGWILAGGKYDCADLDDTTRSQVYEETRNARADVAVMETTGVGIFDPDRDRLFVPSTQRKMPTRQSSVFANHCALVRHFSVMAGGCVNGGHSDGRAERFLRRNQMS